MATGEKIGLMLFILSTAHAADAPNQWVWLATMLGQMIGAALFVESGKD